jgi:hypothetical protein
MLGVGESESNNTLLMVSHSVNMGEDINYNWLYVSCFERRAMRVYRTIKLWSHINCVMFECFTFD